MSKTLVEAIHSELIAAKAKNNSFSQRGMARRLQLSSGALTDLLQGKRKISKKMAEKICERLSLNPSLKEKVLKEFEKKNAVPVKAFANLSLDQFETIAEIEHFAILSLMNTKQFKPSVDWIAARLNISSVKAVSALDRLERIGLIKKQGKGFVRTSPATKTPDNIASAAVKRANREGLHRAEKAIDTFTPQERDITTYLTVGSPAELEKVRELIRDFQNELSHLLDKGERSDVYQLSVQFFPLTETKRTN